MFPTNKVIEEAITSPEIEATNPSCQYRVRISQRDRLDGLNVSLVSHSDGFKALTGDACSRVITPPFYRGHAKKFVNRCRSELTSFGDFGDDHESIFFEILEKSMHLFDSTAESDYTESLTTTKQMVREMMDLELRRDKPHRDYITLALCFGFLEQVNKEEPDPFKVHTTMTAIDQHILNKKLDT